jgi:hypothetical protein
MEIHSVEFFLGIEDGFSTKGSEVLEEERRLSGDVAWWPVAEYGARGNGEDLAEDLDIC